MGISGQQSPGRQEPDPGNTLVADRCRFRRNSSWEANTRASSPEPPPRPPKPSECCEHCGRAMHAPDFVCDTPTQRPAVRTNLWGLIGAAAIVTVLVVPALGACQGAALLDADGTVLPVVTHDGH